MIIETIYLKVSVKLWVNFGLVYSFLKMLVDYLVQILEEFLFVKGYMMHLLKFRDV